jgi:hypothetical protein
MEFKNTQDRDMYLQHPAHTKIANENIHPALRDGMNSVIVFDYNELSFNKND